MNANNANIGSTTNSNSNGNELKLSVPTSGATLGTSRRPQAEFVTYKIYDEPVAEGAQPVWFANISFLKEQKDVGEFYLTKLVEAGVHHSFMSAEEQTDRPTVSKDSIASRFAKLGAK